MIIFLISCESTGQEVNNSHELTQTSQELSVGASQMESYLSLLEGKNIGVVANQTSEINQVHLVDTLLSRGVNIKRVFAPEHGFRGDADAGELIANGKDVKTGLPLISLYGKNKKPQSEQLKGLDIVIFDIQDVGVRFYTYISTLHYVLEACAENNVQVIVLDRPNPNGDIVDGPVLDLDYKSFVGMHEIPIYHGLTIGEYAKMLNGEKWLDNAIQCELTVITCKNYTHQTRYSIPIPPSPNLKSDKAIELYPSLCLFEGTTVSVGRGTETPFELFAHPKFPDSLEMVIPISRKGASNPLYKNKKCFAFQPMDFEQRQFNLDYLIQAQNILGNAMFDNERFFNLLAGSDKLLKQLKSNKTSVEIRKSWEQDLIKFKEIRKKYLLYEDNL